MHTFWKGKFPQTISVVDKGILFEIPVVEISNEIQFKSIWGVFTIDISFGCLENSELFILLRKCFKLVFLSEYLVETCNELLLPCFEVIFEIAESFIVLEDLEIVYRKFIVKSILTLCDRTKCGSLFNQTTRSCLLCY